MKFSSDELMPFFAVRTGMSKHLDDAQAGKEIVITRHGKPTGALVSAMQLYRYRELNRLMGELTEAFKLQPKSASTDSTSASLAALIEEAQQLLAKPVEGTQ